LHIKSDMSMEKFNWLPPTSYYKVDDVVEEGDPIKKDIKAVNKIIEEESKKEVQKLFNKEEKQPVKAKNYYASDYENRFDLMWLPLENKYVLAGTNFKFEHMNAYYKFRDEMRAAVYHKQVDLANWIWAY
jgi:hypothetical protein